jgi:8-oxo-dGTP pyrophosphatase MutT (NUDIX family)
MIRVKIVQNDVSTVAKVVLIDQKKRTLFLKRSKYVEKFAGDWDLPGGHLKVSESLPEGLAREVKEETTLEVRDPVFLLQMDNIHFFYAMYDSQPIELSHEHIDFKFFEEKELDPNQKFQKVALKALEARGV